MLNIRSNIIKYIFIPPILVSMFIFSIYATFIFQVRYVHVFPVYVIFTVLTFFTYDMSVSIIVNSIITTVALIGILFVDGSEKIFLFCEVLCSWIILLILSKYEAKELETRQRLDLVFEELDKEKRLVEIDYSKEKDLIIDLKNKLDKYQNLSTMAELFTGKLDLDKIYELILSTVVSVLQKGEVNILDLEEDNLFTGWVKKQGTPLLVKDIERDYRFAADLVEDSTSKSLMLIPLWNENKLYSFLQASSNEPNAYQEEDLRLVLIIADIASLAITTTSLFNQRQDLVITDSLTKVFNRRYFVEICNEELERAKRYKLPLCLLLMDIDYFKRYNDTYGHLHGDKILRSVAKVFDDNIRETDLVARYGGEEFVILLMASLDDAYRKAENIRAFIESSCGVTISIGVAIASEDDSVESLVSLADQALYKAKDNGRNQVVCYHS